MNLLMKYSTHLLTLFTGCLCAWGGVNWGELSAIQQAVVGFSVLITLHEWEEMHWPGGFMDMMGSIIGWDMSGIRPGAEHTSQSMFIALFLILPILFPDTRWLFCGVMILGIGEGIIHVVGIKLAKPEKPYTPGMATGIVMILYCVAAIVFVYGEGSISVVQWLLGGLYFVIWFFLMQQMVITFCQFNRREFMGAMLGMMKSRLKG